MHKVCSGRDWKGGEVEQWTPMARVGGGGGGGRCGDDTGSGDDDGIKVEVQKILL